MSSLRSDPRYIQSVFADEDCRGEGDYYEQLLAGDKTAKVVLINDSHHFIMFDQPQAFYNAVSAFLKPISSQARFGHDLDGNRSFAGRTRKILERARRPEKGRGSRFRTYVRWQRYDESGASNAKK